MRWRRPEHGATKLVARFLWRPLAIGTETRWLECATWEEQWWDPEQVWLESLGLSEETTAYMEKHVLATMEGQWKKRRWVADQ